MKGLMTWSLLLVVPATRTGTKPGQPEWKRRW